MAINSKNISEWLKNLQDNICASLELADGKAKFETDNWKRKEGGGGRTRIIRNGNVIEKGGVLFSAVYGEAPDFIFSEKEHSLISIKKNSKKKAQFFATGVSIVIHPLNPMVPIIHMNIRYFEMTPPQIPKGKVIKWLGGGIDLTPHYINVEDAKYFHSQLKKVCDKHHPDYYSDFKKWADDYFYIKHRKESRGIGGIFFDRLAENKKMTFDKNLNFWKETGELFAPVYTELIKRNAKKEFTQQNKNWQVLRRGRYVEFNLIYDKGTKFGLETNGRVESILMSLPRTAGWEYDFKPEKNSEEEKTLKTLNKITKWV